MGSAKLDLKLLSERVSQISKRPRRIGDGPASGSTSHALERQPLRWDTNQFYARLGLTPDAARVEIARRFLDVGGLGSSAMTTATKVLLDSSSRRSYDALTLGSFWAADEALIHHHLDPGDLVGATDGEWAIYADFDVLSASALAIDPLWRTRLGYIMWRAGVVMQFAIGATNGEARIEGIGYEIVVFLPLAIEPKWEYVTLIAQQMLTIFHAS